MRWPQAYSHLKVWFLPWKVEFSYSEGGWRPLHGVVASIHVQGLHRVYALEVHPGWVTHCFDLLQLDEGCIFAVFCRHLWSHSVRALGQLDINLPQIRSHVVVVVSISSWGHPRCHEPKAWTVVAEPKCSSGSGRGFHPSL